MSKLTSRAAQRTSSMLSSAEEPKSPAIYQGGRGLASAMLLLLLPLGLAMGACATTERSGSAPMLGSSGGARGVPDQVAGGACESGAQQACSETLAQNGSVATCLEGTQACEDAIWGACEGAITVKSVWSPGPGGLIATALSVETNCVGNPCDPSCQVYNEDPPDITPPTVIGGGSISSLPGGFQNKLLKDGNHPPNGPCTVSSDCQGDHRCDLAAGGVCKRWLLDEFDATAGGPDFTLGVPCGGNVPVCNRGNVQAPAGAVVAIVNGNSSQLQGNLGSCAGSAGTFNSSCTITDPINPGECVNALSYGCAIPGGTKGWVINSADYVAVPIVEADCGNNWSVSSGNPPCVVSYRSQEVKETYTGTCSDPNDVVQWGFLTYASSTPSSGGTSSTIAFSAHTAEPPTAILADCSDCTLLATAPTTHPQSCVMAGPAPCPVNLFDALGLPSANESVLELVFNLEPSANELAGPTLESWEITYSCVAAK